MMIMTHVIWYQFGSTNSKKVVIQRTQEGKKKIRFGNDFLMPRLSGFLLRSEIKQAMGSRSPIWLRFVARSGPD